MSAPSINLAGKTERVGGAFASATGALVLIVGLSMALAAWMLLYAITTMAVALAVALPAALVTLGVGGVLVGGGRKLRRSGTDAERSTREQALMAAAIEKGPLTAAAAARLVGVSPAEADAILTSLAKRQPERLSVDVDDQGVISYRAAGAGPEARVRVEEEFRKRLENETEENETEANARKANERGDAIDGDEPAETAGRSPRARR